MTGCTRADLLIGGISLVPANVAAFHRQYAFQRIEHRFSAPEASACQSGNFLSHMPAFADMSVRIDRAARHRIPAIIEPFPSDRPFPAPQPPVLCGLVSQRSEEHTSELQSLMRISYAVFCLKKKQTNQTQYYHTYYI